MFCKLLFFILIFYCQYFRLFILKNSHSMLITPHALEAMGFSAFTLSSILEFLTTHNNS